MITLSLVKKIKLLSLHYRHLIGARKRPFLHYFIHTVCKKINQIFTCFDVDDSLCIVASPPLSNLTTMYMFIYMYMHAHVHVCNFSALQVFLYLLRVILGGPLFGYVMGRLTVWWLSHVFNDAVVEITITLASTYFTYYVGDVFFGVSGVLAVVTFGIVINARRTNISPAVDVFLYK